MGVTKGGLPGLTDIAWGSHLCHFYDSRADLLDTLLPFVRAGLENNEACLWLTAEPLSAADARASLSAAVPDFDQRQQNRQIEIIEREQWHKRIGRTDAIDAWIHQANLAVTQGFSGLRLISNVGQHSSAHLPIEERFGAQQLIGLFGYCIAHCTSQDVLDIANRYQFTWTRYRNLAEIATAAEPRAAEQASWLQRTSGPASNAEEKLRESNKRQDDFLAMLAHELRNPLGSILTASQLMTLRGGEQQFQKELDIIQRQVSHMTSMVEDLLDASRILAGRAELKCTSLEMAGPINRAIEIATPLVVKRSHRLHVSCAPHGLAVKGDPLRLAQVVARLLTNAARYMEPGGDITVRAERTGSDVAVVVADTGRGIDPSRLTAIFQPFGQRGSGLGLSIVRSLVGLHGGTIEANSTVGKGSEFVVRLPALERSSSLETS